MGYTWFKGIIADLCIKGQTVGNDWWYLNPAWIAARDTGEALDRLQEMLDRGKSYPMDDAETRDGMFVEDAIFLVFEKADLLRLRAMIDAAAAR